MKLRDTLALCGTIKENIRYAKPDATDEETLLQLVRPGSMSLSSSFLRVMTIAGGRVWRILPRSAAVGRALASYDAKNPPICF